MIMNPKKMIVDNISVRGYSHITADRECQDSSISWRTDHYCAAIVCDGHGGEKYIRSAVGSRLACEVGKEVIDRFMKVFTPSNTKQIDSDLEQLERAIVSGWYRAVKEEYERSPVTEDKRFDALEDSDKKSLGKNPVKAYGSTFIAAVKTDRYCFVLQLGDGNTVLFYTNGKSEIPQALEDENCAFNVTTSLCNSDAALSFRHMYKEYTKEETVSGITLTSDGVINCYKSEEGYISFMENVYFGFGEDGAEKAKEDLIPALNRLSERGSGDDLSVAIIRNPFLKDELKLIAQKKEKEEQGRILREAEQARMAEERARREAEQTSLKTGDDQSNAAKDAAATYNPHRVESEKIRLQQEEEAKRKQKLFRHASRQDEKVDAVTDPAVGSDITVHVKKSGLFGTIKQKFFPDQDKQK